MAARHLYPLLSRTKTTLFGSGVMATLDARVVPQVQPLKRQPGRKRNTTFAITFHARNPNVTATIRLSSPQWLADQVFTIFFSAR